MSTYLCLNTINVNTIIAVVQKLPKNVLGVRFHAICFSALDPNEMSCGYGGAGFRHVGPEKGKTETKTPKIQHWCKIERTQFLLFVCEWDYTESTHMNSTKRERISICFLRLKHFHNVLDLPGNNSTISFLVFNNVQIRESIISVLVSVPDLLSPKACLNIWTWAPPSGDFE